MTTIHFPEEKEFDFVESYIVVDTVNCDRKPFGDVSAEDYFEYAKSARARGDKSSLVDSLSNAKRCYNYQVDRLLYRYGLLNATKDLNFPSKAQLLSELNIVPSSLLRTYNSNEMEHGYTTPTQDVVDGSIDLCDLLFLATERYLTDTPARIRIKLKNDDRDLLFLVEPGGTRIEFYQIHGSEIQETEHGKFFSTQFHIPMTDEKDWINKDLKIIRLANQDIEIKKENKEKWFPYIRLICHQARKRSEKVVIPAESMVTLSTSFPWKAVKNTFEIAWKRQLKD